MSGNQRGGPTAGVDDRDCARAGASPPPGSATTGGAEESTRQLLSPSPPRAAASPRARPYPPCVRRIRPAADASPRLAGRASRAGGEHRAGGRADMPVTPRASGSLRRHENSSRLWSIRLEACRKVHNTSLHRESSAISTNSEFLCCMCAVHRSKAQRDHHRPELGSSLSAKKHGRAAIGGELRRGSALVVDSRRLAQCLGNFERLACARLPGNNIGSLTAFAKETMRILLTVPT